MKRKMSSLLLCIMLLPVLILHVHAASDLPMVADNADLLSASEEQALEEKAQSLRSEYELDVVIVTADSLGGKSAQDYADDYFDQNGYGYGSNYNGILFLISMAEQEWYISTCGDTIYAVTDYGVQQLGDIVVGYLADGDYYGGFNAFMDALTSYLDAYQNGSSIDGYADYSGDYYHGDRDEVVYYEKDTSPNLFVSLMIGAVSAAVVILIMRSSMNTKRQQRGASSYLKPGSFHLRSHQDMFLYSNVSKVRRQQNNGSSGGGSSVHRSSGGRRHGGGGGKF